MGAKRSRALTSLDRFHFPEPEVIHPGEKRRAGKLLIDTADHYGWGPQRHIALSVLNKGTCRRAWVDSLEKAIQAGMGLESGSVVRSHEDSRRGDPHSGLPCLYIDHSSGTVHHLGEPEATWQVMNPTNVRNILDAEPVDPDDDPDEEPISDDDPEGLWGNPWE